MNNTADVFARFEPEALGLATVQVAPRTWLPFSVLQPGRRLDTALWQTRAARGLSWHRTGAVGKRLSRQ